MKRPKTESSLSIIGDWHDIQHAKNESWKMTIKVIVDFMQVKRLRKKCFGI